MREAGEAAPLEEIPLEGGNLSQVVRAGDTVRRALKPWSPAVHALLHHLEAQGFDGCPRLLGIDGQGREILSYIKGEVGFPEAMWTDGALFAAARLLRRYHDATTTFRPPPTAPWQLVYPDAARHEVICHNDFAPYNLVFVGSEPVALIDFDVAGPGPRLRDVAMGAYWFAPLAFSAELAERSAHDLTGGGRRLRLFCATYGLPADGQLLDMVADWLQFMATFPLQQIAAGRTEYRRLVEDGHLAHWQREHAAFCDRRPAIEEALSR
jgi:hypothetical protein